MSLLARRPSVGQRSTWPDVEVAHRVIGNAMVVHTRDNLSDEAVALAISVAPDPENDLVVVDLPNGSPISAWESLASCLPPGKHGVRLVLGGRSREATALAGQWLSQRIRRPVIAPDGAVLRGAGGSLFVHSGPDSGWVRFHPNRPPQREAKRFPRPSWDSFTTEVHQISATGTAEPLPAGVWIRPAGHEPQLSQARLRLTNELPCQPDLLTVVLGCPSAPGVFLDDVLQLCAAFPPGAWRQVRFVHYGPVVHPADVPAGQALANALGWEVICYTGLPVVSQPVPDVFTLREDGSLGWNAFAQQVSYWPQETSGNPPPMVRAHRQPVHGLAEIAPATYWYSPEAVLEVVQAGLWVRPARHLANADAVRAVPVSPTENLLVFDADHEDREPRMRALAEDVLRRLDHSTRQVSRLISATALPTPQVRVIGRAQGRVVEPDLHREVDPVPGARPADAAVVPTPTGVPAEPVAPVTTVGPAPVLAAPTDVPVPALPEPPGIRPTVATTDVPRNASPKPEFGAQAMPVAPLSPVSMRLESELSDPRSHSPNGAETGGAPAAVGAATPSVPTAAPGEPAEVPAPAASTPRAGTRLQPTPSSAASALLPTRGIEEERAWLRKNLGSRFGVLANTVARVLSEHPGFQGAVSRSSSEVLTEAVAVQVYLSEQGAGLDAALRTATVGPHVPFARCVVAGLERLPSHRGATVFTMTPTPEQWRYYRGRQLFTDWGFVNSLIEPCAGQQGDTDVLVWSITARRTRLLEPDVAPVDERVLFMPGTGFKVLEATEPTADGRGRILMRELAVSEIDNDGRVDAKRISLDELAMTSLHRTAGKWATAPARQRVPDSSVTRFQALPGLA
jgi:hypothetical protein